MYDGSLFVKFNDGRVLKGENPNKFCPVTGADHII